MKILLTFLGLFYFSWLYAAEVDVICHCVNECERATKCEGAYASYIGLIKSGSNSVPKNENDFLLSHKLSSLEFVDWGSSQCGTVYGVVGEETYRYDFELQGNNIAKSSLSKVSSIPTLNERKAAKSEDLCLFRL